MMTQIQSLINDIADIGRNRLCALKKINRPKMGWFSVYTPEEIIHAAGLIPFRIISIKVK